MVLALNTIWNEGPFLIRVENHRDRYCASIPPSQSEKFIGARWIDKGSARTVLTIVLDPDEHHRPPVEDARDDDCWVPPGKNTAVISLEDISWQLVLKGDVQGGEVRIPVNGNKDFDIVVRKDGTLAIRCLGGAFVNGKVQEIIRLPEFSLPAVNSPLSPLPAEHTDAVASSSKYAQSPEAPSSVSSSSSSASPPPTTGRPAQSSYSLSDISPELLTLLDELRADQRRILQKEFQLVGAGFAEKFDWLMIGGRRLMKAADPSEYLPMAALINILVIPLIFLFSYYYAARRRSRASTATVAGSTRRRSPPAWRPPSTTATRQRITARGEGTSTRDRSHATLGERDDRRDDNQEDDEAPPPYPEEEGRALF